MPDMPDVPSCFNQTTLTSFNLHQGPSYFQSITEVQPKAHKQKQTPLTLSATLLPNGSPHEASP